MSTPAAKRRRIDAASQTLSKPFRSPFKTPLKSPLKAPTPKSSSSAQLNISTPLKPSLEGTLPLLKDKSTNLSATTPNRTSPAHNPHKHTPAARASQSRPSRREKTFSSPVSTAALNADPDIAPLLRTQRDLERQLREVKEELEQAEQARKIERESRKKGLNGDVDGDLVVLVEKWRGASRLAAEELFGKVRDRVNRMGGPRAWKEMQKNQHEFQSEWDVEVQNNNEDIEDEVDSLKNVEKRDIYAEYGDPETENEKSQRQKGVGDTGELPGEEDEFTMAMMLRTLNVDLDIIGYDKQQQRWTD